MGILRNVSSFRYAKIDGWDADEKKHREAQFLIYKTLQQADRVVGSRRKPAAASRPSWLFRLRISKLRVKIGRRLMRLRKTVVLGFSKARAGLCKQVSTRLKVWSRLFNGDAAAAAPSTAVVRLPQPLLS